MRAQFKTSEDPGLGYYDTNDKSKMFYREDSYVNKWGLHATGSSIYINYKITCHSFCSKCTGPLNTQCTECKSGYLLSGTTCKQVVCHSACSKCTGSLQTQCTACNTGYSLSGTTCVKCSSAQFFKTSTKTCVNCGKGCSKCTDEKSCHTCEPGKISDGSGGCKVVSKTMCYKIYDTY